MGLFSFIFGKKKKTADNAFAENNKMHSKQGIITTRKVELTSKNYDSICKQFIAFDVETTGLSAANDVIIEVGAVWFVDGKAIKAYGSLINEGIPVPESATRVNHITTKMLIDHGKNPKIVYRELNDFWGDVLSGNICLCAHNASFDIQFICNALEYLGYSGNIQYIDTLSLSRRILKGLPDYKQDTIAKVFGLKNKDSHRATSDAETCGKILVNLLELKKEDIEREKTREEKCKPTDEEREVFAIIANAMKQYGSDIQNLRTYRNTSNYVSVLDIYTVFKYKLTKNKSYVIVPKSYAKGLPKVEECTITEGTDNIRILFDDPFELDDYGKIFSRIHVDMRKSQGAHMNQYEVQYLSQANLTGFSESEIREYLECARNRQKKQAELREQAIQKEIEKAKLLEEKKEKKEIQKQETEKKKQLRAQARIEQQQLLRNMLENSTVVSQEDVCKIAKLSAESGKRAVLQLDDESHILRIYESIKEASDSVGIAPKTIRDVANGKYKHGGGFCWAFADTLYDNEN